MVDYFPSFGLLICGFLTAAYFYQKYQPPPKPTIVGLDLGTTYSSIGTFHAVSGDVTIYDLYQSHKSIPSQLYFGLDGNIYLGYEAQVLAQQNSSYLVYDAKRFIGKKFTDAELLELTQLYPFDLKNWNGNIYFAIPMNYHVQHGTLNDILTKLGTTCSTPTHFTKFTGSRDYEAIIASYNKSHIVWHSNTLYISPECIGALIISFMVGKVKEKINRNLGKGIMAVPADFDSYQEAATNVAANMAGLEILRTISEPTAAALSCGLHLKRDLKHVIVIDIGGGTTDISMLSLRAGMFYVQSLSGNNRLGGQDFNYQLLHYILHVDIKRLYGENVQIQRNADLEALKMGVERAKLYVCTIDNTVNLDHKAYYTIEMPLHLVEQKTGGHSNFDVNNEKNVDTVVVNYAINVTRELFDMVNEPTVNAIIDAVEECLKQGHIYTAQILEKDSNLKSKLSKHHGDWIQEVVLVGGSVKVPLVYERINQYFERAWLHYKDLDNETQQTIENDWTYEYYNNNEHSEEIMNNSNTQQAHPLYQTHINLPQDPELAVSKGVSVMAGILGGAWPLSVSATEPYPRRNKKHQNIDHLPEINGNIRKLNSSEL